MSGIILAQASGEYTAFLSAEAGLILSGRFTARLEAAPFQNVRLFGAAEAVPFPVRVRVRIKIKGGRTNASVPARAKSKSKVKSKVKGVGQECPTHTGKVKGSGRGRPLYIRYANSRPSGWWRRCQASR